MDERDQVRTPGQYLSADPNKFFNVVAAALGAKAGHNHYQQTGDLQQAAGVGIGAFVRWMVWMITLGVWFFNSFFVAAWETGSNTPIYTALIIAPFTLGVTWCRNVDYSLFRRGLIYKLYAPVARLIEGVPSFVLYLLVLAPTFVG
jgi:hypothetical protein